LVKMFQPADLQVMYEVRQAMDPAQLANRGKMLFYPGSVLNGVSPAQGPRASRPRLASGTIDVESIQHLQDLIAEADGPVTLRGARTKPARSASRDGFTTLDFSRLSGIIEYEPSEFTITALAGTRIAEVQRLLAEHGQFLPFDPVLAEAGATLGGTVAAAGRGPASLRYGGVRDFLIGVRFVDGQGRLIRGGGKVVKNAAGFDLPKLIVGSAGTLGVLAELTFKVFPRPENYLSLSVETSGLTDSLDLIRELSATAVEFEALDLLPPKTVLLRLGGRSSTLRQRAEKLVSILKRACSEVQEAAWEDAREFRWVPRGASLWRVPTTVTRIPKLEERLVAEDCPRRYSLAGNVCWLTSRKEEADVDGMPYFGTSRRVPCSQGASDFARRVKSVLDPKGRFGA
ncbi:MAG: FAD-binding protein, partial [Acidobacteria bacterium]